MEPAKEEESSVQDEAVDKSNFKNCNHIAFYRRQKLLHPGKSLYQALLDSVTLCNDSVKLQIINEKNKVPLLVEIYAIEGNIFRLKINEVSPLKSRYEVPDVLIKEPTTQRLSIAQKEAGILVLTCASEDRKLHITANPFQIELESKGETVLSVNTNGLLYFEHLQPPPQNSKTTAQKEEDTSIGSSQENQEDLGLWQEEFGSFLDIKANGTQALPPLFSLGYHQCRWNYEDEQDVKTVDTGFDEHDIPYDVIWLDIEHTEGKRYFTWDKKKFQHPKRMQELLKRKKRKLVVIIDPHIKVDPMYTLYSQAKKKGYFVKNRTGQDFEGICWPGSSSYLDFTNPEVREWYADQFAFKSYKGSTDILFVWNDMNEPSVFKAAELTMQRDAVHHGNWEHREVHNLYGFYQQMATAEGLIKRSGGQRRPFVLTRSFFAGSQKYGAVWTGDNVAEWSYLKISIPMLLTISIAGISFCGADVGGFIGDPEPELLVRWYQAGAYQPFFRGHANIESKRREPWLFGDENTRIIREAIRERYTLLPYLYSLFYRAHTTAEPVMRPLWVEFPKEQETFGVEDEYMLGNALLVHPVIEQEATTVNVLLPGSDEVWYDFRRFRRLDYPGTLKIPVTLESIPVFQRGGCVVPLKTTVGRSTEWMTDISYELHVALDSKDFAVGELYLDDGHSFQYLHKKQFLHRKFTFHKNVFSSSCADEFGQYHTKCVVERVLILGVQKQPTSVTVSLQDGKDKEVVFTYDVKSSMLTLEKLLLNVGADWEIHIK
ncbi:neutral alpha-glucosidase C isoform X2 [Terrapene carolina triunguis]|uniref:neutral alpha-glucosidase C isoform X2 n=1 Tax=Terrapene triunguis TaxID=2587831 RepID=UPI000CEF6E41|nr:neutral alpha-glucosidase C isoform X2 [Terrapene carolina triunguis]